MRFISLVAILFFSVTAHAATGDWTKTFWEWAQGPTPNDATNNALTAAQADITPLRTQCDTTQGVLTTNTQDGYCATDNDPMFCQYGCYSCPVYATATCTHGQTALQVGSLVDAIANASLYSGSTVVGAVAKGDKFHITQIQDQWASLQKLDGTAVRGWIQLSDLELATP